MNLLEKIIWANVYTNELSRDEYNISRSIELADNVVMDLRTYISEKTKLHALDDLELERLEEINAYNTFEELRRGDGKQ